MYIDRKGYRENLKNFFSTQNLDMTDFNYIKVGKELLVEAEVKFFEDDVVELCADERSVYKRYFIDDFSIKDAFNKPHFQDEYINFMLYRYGKPYLNKLYFTQFGNRIDRETTRQKLSRYKRLNEYQTTLDDHRFIKNNEKIMSK